jgi:hypothetical protein
MTNGQPPPSGFLKNLRIVYLSLLSGLVFFAIIAYLIRQKTGAIIGPRELNILTYISLIFILIELPLGYWLHSRKIKIISGWDDLNTKLNEYRASFLVKIAMFEGAGFLSCLVLLLGGTNLVLAQIVIVLIFMMFENPSSSKLANELGLSEGDKNMLDS